MAGYNKNFELSVEDLALIEDALRKETAKAPVENSDAKRRARDVHDLLGRLHNQKRFYRPRNGVYVGG
ncbi:MAG: hypothetical protein AAGD04_05195 [Pseudomonadota bacterium]